METLLCVNAHVLHHFGHMDPVNALFWNLVSGCKNPKTLPLHSRVDGESTYFAYRWHHRPVPRLLAFDLLTPRRLITTTTTTTTTTTDYMLVFVQQKILRLSGLLGQNITLLYHYAERKRIMDKRLAIFVFFFFFFYSAQALCFLLLRFWWVPSTTYRLKYELQQVVINGSVWTQIFLKRYQGRWGKKDCFGTCEHGLTCCVWGLTVSLEGWSEVLTPQTHIHQKHTYS